MTWREMGLVLVINWMRSFKTKTDPLGQHLLKYCSPGSSLASRQPRLCLRLTVQENAVPFLRFRKPRRVGLGKEDNKLSLVPDSFLKLLHTFLCLFFHLQTLIKFLLNGFIVYILLHLHLQPFPPSCWPRILFIGSCSLGESKEEFHLPTVVKKLSRGNSSLTK